MPPPRGVPWTLPPGDTQVCPEGLGKGMDSAQDEPGEGRPQPGLGERARGDSREGAMGGGITGGEQQAGRGVGWTLGAVKRGGGCPGQRTGEAHGSRSPQG